MPAQASVDTNDDTSHLHKRLDVTCNNYDQALRFRIQEGISHLRGVNGKPRNGPGPGNCGRVSCSYNSAIWWCNDVSVFTSRTRIPRANTFDQNGRTHRRRPLAGLITLPIVLRSSSIDVTQRVAISPGKKTMGINGEASSAGLHAERSVSGQTPLAAVPISVTHFSTKLGLVYCDFCNYFNSIHSFEHVESSDSHLPIYGIALPLLITIESGMARIYLRVGNHH